MCHSLISSNSLLNLLEISKINNTTNPESEQLENEFVYPRRDRYSLFRNETFAFFYAPCYNFLSVSRML